MVKVKFTLDRQRDRWTDRVIPIHPQTSFSGGIMRYRWIGNSLNFLIMVTLWYLKNIAQNVIHSKVKNCIFLGVVLRLGKTSLYQLARKTSFTKVVLQ